jgi:hypothetical protein
MYNPLKKTQERLEARAITYFTYRSSTVTSNGMRRFLVTTVSDVGFCDKTQSEYVRCEVIDLDDGFTRKHKTLHLASIDVEKV